MNEPRRKDPTFGVGVFIVVAVLLVIGTVLFNAIRDKREYDQTNAAAASAAAASATSPSGASAAQ
ncbi:hypothetical protein [Paraburkholderia caballeronis]|uniref:Uncharacterized protein n=1 Tax=Paraburkholderia caballeronis TaxID=416943 RepID=A0A1H7K479_9BURK|nr:hypothetical protein [Paraburkholderia caballeronis]PXW27133.1 hypothetical protein C7403_10338 [Paraburkholderia caballeronis]PXX02607.1 hypothetical protein C7407_10338 [Paraburkholderia caballeronis]RAK03332.1 hypothetical protein C7409_10338 [Paraburkholderia caballeronis]TDV11610.1 hypothetical protein C7406_12086 [Paraburkholderia caballeronis]TDV17383.1 hypothetical protein C7408_10436 [Paraburkholderia caballeronis]